jgi:hypothetical protein
MFYFCRIGEIRAHAPPNPSQPARKIELFSQFRNDFRVSVSFEERGREWDPLPARHTSDHIEQKNQQVIGLSRRRWKRLVVDNFEIDQSRAIGSRIIKNILSRGVAMRPATTKFVGPKFVRASKFGRGRLQHSFVQTAALDQIVEADAWQFFRDHAAFPRTVGVKAIAVEHLETAHFPSPPFVHFAPKSNRNIGNAKIEIG